MCGAKVSVGPFLFFLSVPGDWTKDKEALAQNVSVQFSKLQLQLSQICFEKPLGLVLPVHT